MARRKAPIIDLLGLVVLQRGSGELEHRQIGLEVIASQTDVSHVSSVAVNVGGIDQRSGHVDVFHRNALLVQFHHVLKASFGLGSIAQVRVDDADAVERLRSARRTLRARLDMQLEGARVAFDRALEIALQPMRPADVEEDARYFFVVGIRRFENGVEVLLGFRVLAHFEKEIAEHELDVRLGHFLLLILHVFRGQHGALVGSVHSDMPQIFRLVVDARFDLEGCT